MFTSESVVDLTDTDAQETVNSLQVLESIGPSVHTSLLQKVVLPPYDLISQSDYIKMFFFIYIKNSQTTINDTFQQQQPPLKDIIFCHWVNYIRN